MKTAVLLFIFTLLFASCNKEEEKINIEDVQIYQTVWEGTYHFQPDPENIRVTEGKIQLAFEEEDVGYRSMECFGENDNQWFSYIHKNNQLIIDWNYLQGTWMITPTGKNSIRLTRYKSYEKADILELERVDNQ